MASISKAARFLLFPNIFSMGTNNRFHETVVSS